MIDHDPVDIAPLTLAPVRVMGVGVADEQVLSGPPAVAVAVFGFTVMVLSDVVAQGSPGLLVVNLKVTVPV